MNIALQPSVRQPFPGFPNSKGRNSMKPVLMHGAAASVALVMAAASFPNLALATPPSNFAPSGIVNGHFGTLNLTPSDGKTDKWGLILKTLDQTDIGSDRLTVQSGGFSGWHAHPGPVFVTVTQGSITWYDGSDPLCTAHNYTVGDSFIEGPYRVHNVQNTGGSTAEFIAITIKPEGFVGPQFRLDRPAPNNCNF